MMESSKDSGWSWVVLFGVFITYSLSSGLLPCISVFLVDWQEYFEASAEAVSWCTAVAIAGFGISGLMSSIISPYVSCRWQAFFGGLVSSCSLMSAPWIMRIEHLYIMMSLMGVGLGFAFTNCIIVLSYYFQKKLAFANGLGMSGGSIGMLIFAPLVRYLIDEYSWRGAMLICGGMLGNICVFSALFRLSQAEVISMTGKRPEVTDTTEKSKRNIIIPNCNLRNENIAEHNCLPSKATRKRSVARNIRRHSETFVESYTNVLLIRFPAIVVASGFLYGFGYYTALMFFVANAINLGIPKTDAAFLLSIIGICGAIGRLSCGPIIDNNIITVFHLATLLLGIAGSSCLLGSLAKSFEALVIFAVVLGFSATTVKFVWPMLTRKVVGVNNYKKIFGIHVLISRAACLISFPVMGHVYDVTGDYRISFYAAGGALLLNSIIIVMDHVWIGLDKRRLEAEQNTKEADCKDVKTVQEETRVVSENVGVQTKSEFGISNPALILLYREEASSHGADVFL